MKLLRIAYLGLFVLLAARAPAAQSVNVEGVVAELEPEILKRMAEGQIPSCTIALVAGDAVIWSGAYGYSNLWARTKAVPETVYLIGSTFKTQATAALLQLMEKGKFKLDDRVSDFLKDFEIQGEDSADPVTFRHLLTHTSGLPVAFGPHPVWGDSVPKPIESFLKDSLKVRTPPGQKVVYSNMAYTLIAHLVQEFSGEDFKGYMKRRVFDPLEMKDTVFAPTPKHEERLAIPYALDVRTKKLVPAVRLKADVWPAGIVYGTVNDQANWLIAILNGGSFKGRRLLKESTVKSTLERQYDRFGGPMAAGWGNETAGFGLTWWVSRKDGDRHFAHSGSVPGYTAFLEGNADRRLGFAILTNGHRAHPHLVKLADLSIRLMKKHRRPESVSGSSGGLD